MQKNGTKKSNLARDAEIMELFYAGEPIKIIKLAAQLKMDRSDVRKILMKYGPATTGRNVVMLIDSELNRMWGQGDYELKQESQEE